MGCSVPEPLSSLEKRVLTTQMLQFPKRGLTQLGPTGHLSACNPNTRQGPLASNKLHWPRKQTSQPEEYSPAHIMINLQRGGPRGHSDNESFPELLQVQKAWGGALACARVLDKDFLAPAGRALYKDQPLYLPQVNRGTDITTPESALAKFTLRTPIGASSQEAAAPQT